MNRSFRLILILAVCVTAGCDLSFNRDAELENAIATLIHDEIRQNPLNIQRFQDPAVYVTITGEDPSEEFLKHFKGTKFPVKKGSEFPAEKANELGAGDGVGVAYRIESWEWLAHDELKIRFSYQCGLKCGGTSQFHLVRKKSGWIVNEREWITAE